MGQKLARGKEEMEQPPRSLQEGATRVFTHLLTLVRSCPAYRPYLQR